MPFSWICQSCGRTFAYDTKQKLAVAKYKHQTRVGECGPPSKLPDGRANPAYFSAWYSRNKDTKLAYEKRDYATKREPWKTRARNYYATHSLEVAQANKAYHNTPRGREVYRKAAVKTQARRRGLKIWFTLNARFPGAHLHHVEEHIGAWIPEALHNEVRHNLRTGKNMVKINELVSQWIDEDAQKRLSE